MSVLKKKLQSPGSLFLGGAQDVLSARIVERARYDGIWLSGLGVSVSKRGVPDAKRAYSYGAYLEVCRNITCACSLPVVVDMDCGYGNALTIHIP